MITSNDSSARSEDRKSSRAALRWGGLIVGLLVMQVGLCAWGVYCAVGGRTVAIEPDYYNKALHWDDHKTIHAAIREIPGK